MRLVRRFVDHIACCDKCARASLLPPFRGGRGSGAGGRRRGGGASRCCYVTRLRGLRGHRLPRHLAKQLVHQRLRRVAQGFKGFACLGIVFNVFEPALFAVMMMPSYDVCSLFNVPKGKMSSIFLTFLNSWSWFPRSGPHSSVVRTLGPRTRIGPSERRTSRPPFSLHSMQYVYVGGFAPLTCTSFSKGMY